MKTEDFINCCKAQIYKNITDYWKKGYVDVEYDIVQTWGVNSLIEVSDFHFESIIWKEPFTVDIVMSLDYLVRIQAKKWREPQSGYYIYRYLTKDGLVYIGRTTDPVKRFFEHIREDKKYSQVIKVDICKCQNKSDMILLERLLIAKHTPPWNTVDKDNGRPSFTLPKIKYVRYNLLEFIALY